jgi:DNA primase
MRSETFNCQKAKEIDLVDYLRSLGYSAVKKRNQSFWYLSPFRQEKTASFKVDHRKNLWFDFGAGIGGTIIDFGIRYHRCSVKELLYMLEQEQVTPLPIHRPPEEQEKAPEKISIQDVRAIADPVLKRYLASRNISLALANRYCCQIEFEIYKRKQRAIGFKNDLGGYELRNPEFKGSNSPKSVTHIKNHPDTLLVFEGFFDFLSFHSYRDRKETCPEPFVKSSESFLILNSLAFFEKSWNIMESYHQIDLFLDRDRAGRETTEKALESSSRFRDRSELYRDFKDLNEFLIQSKPEVQNKSLGTRK